MSNKFKSYQNKLHYNLYFHKSNFRVQNKLMDKLEKKVIYGLVEL